MLAGLVTSATLETLKTANKTLRFAKETCKTSLRFPRSIGVNYGLLALSDAAWGTREDGSSQGGYMILAVPPRMFDGDSAEYAIVDWRSWKLDRVSRSSLNAETQAAATAVDVLEFCHSFINLMFEPELVLKTAASHSNRPSALVVDAKSLYDSLKKEAPVQGSSDRRTAIEQIGLKQSLLSVGAHVRWVSSERQMADGLTKISARQLFADRLIKQQYRLVFDGTYTAAKKKKLEQRKVSERERVVIL